MVGCLVWPSTGSRHGLDSGLMPASLRVVAHPSGNNFALVQNISHYGASHETHGASRVIAILRSVIVRGRRDMHLCDESLSLQRHPPEQESCPSVAPALPPVYAARRERLQLHHSIGFTSSTKLNGASVFALTSSTVTPSASSIRVSPLVKSTSKTHYNDQSVITQLPTAQPTAL